MRDDGSPDSVGSQMERAELAVLTILLDREHPWPWCERELAREHGNPLDTEDALALLQRAGLVHRHAGFVFPTRAAARFNEIHHAA
jgi:hypothetical protein